VGSSSSATSTSGPVLSLGSKGPDVVAWQNSLNQWLKLTAPTQTQLTADGTFGPSTQTVTEQLQTTSGLSPDGIVGPSTRQALQAALQGKRSSSGSSSSGSSSSSSPNGSTGGSTSTSSVLKLGDTGQAVVDWQTRLNEWLKATAPTQTQLSTDGNFGQATQSATQQLQTAAGLTPTGQVDDATRQALTAALANAGSGRG
jgi:peptidoglycan hydrolase-like protein with peptidoglycan-binding domain